MFEVLKIDPEFEDVIPPIDADSFVQLEENIVAEGEIIMPIITWNGFIVDGHNRYKILQKHTNIKYRIFEKHFEDKYEAISWICKNQIGTRNLPKRYVRYLRGKQYEAEKQSCKFHGNQYTLAKESGGSYSNQHHKSQRTRAILAERNGVPESEIRYSQEFSRGLDAAEEVLPGIKQEILTEKINPSDKSIKEIALLPIEQRKEAVENLRKITDRRKLPHNNKTNQSVTRITPDTESEQIASVNEDDILNTIGAAVNNLIDMCNNYFTRFPNLLSDENYREKTIATLKEFEIYISKLER